VFWYGSNDLLLDHAWWKNIKYLKRRLNKIFLKCTCTNLSPSLYLLFSRNWMLPVSIFPKASTEKFSGGRGATEKTRRKNSIIKPPSTLSASCIKIQEGAHGLSVWLKGVGGRGTRYHPFIRATPLVIKRFCIFQKYEHIQRNIFW